jgi:accessory colonization factor AcfC
MIVRNLHFLCLSVGVLLIGGPGESTSVPKKTAPVILYGPSGPSPAINESAVAFTGLFGVPVEVRSGPTELWVEQAAQDADLIYSSAEFMMSEFLRTEALHLDPDTLTGLYIRPSVILVRPDNPKGIKDFPDLLKPDVRVMVVEGSGQTGLWEDMAGKLGDVTTLRKLRANIVYFALTSDDAVKAWKERTDIDAWITWNIWHMPNRDRAKLIPVGRDYRVYRQCSIALTERGKANTGARQFVDFLTSADGARIFESWGWLTPSLDARPLTVNTDICAVCRIDKDEWKDGYGRGLLDIKGLLDDYVRLGIPYREVHISAVFHGEAAYWLLHDAAYARAPKGSALNPNAPLVRELQSLGVSVELCAKVMEEKGWTKEDVLDGVRVVPGALPRVIDLQQQGYAYVRF